MKRSNDYIKGFKHGVKWCLACSYTKSKEIEYVDLEKAVKSLKEGR
jgi:hypothetical protein